MHVKLIEKMERNQNKQAPKCIDDSRIALSHTTQAAASRFVLCLASKFG